MHSINAHVRLSYTKYENGEKKNFAHTIRMFLFVFHFVVVVVVIALAVNAFVFVTKVIEG